MRPHTVVPELAARFARRFGRRPVVFAVEAAAAAWSTCPATRRP